MAKAESTFKAFFGYHENQLILLVQQKQLCFLFHIKLTACIHAINSYFEGRVGGNGAVVFPKNACAAAEHGQGC